MGLKFGFSVYGLVIFLLPMAVNLVYAVFPPANGGSIPTCSVKWLEIAEQVTRALFAIAICVLVSDKKPSFTNVWFFAGLVFLILYHVVWLRYFALGRDVSLLGANLLFVPIPLAVFPVLYFLCAAIWLRNLPAFSIMVVFGAAHYAVSYLSFGKTVQ